MNKTLWTIGVEGMRTRPKNAVRAIDTGAMNTGLTKRSESLSKTFLLKTADTGDGERAVVVPRHDATTTTMRHYKSP